MIRRGGVTTTAGGERSIWSVADGRRGRRVREAISRGDTLVRTVLLELDPAGRCTRLELATAHGLLTLHPDRDGDQLHGNVVGPAGVRHLNFDWSADRELFVAGSPASTAIVAARGVRTVLRIDDELDPRMEPWDPAGRSDGQVAALTAEDGWPLELD
ncbi:MAG TPA: hypothetical protein VIH00_04260 [Candidatus Limnocylindrales bacterium]